MKVKLLKTIARGEIGYSCGLKKGEIHESFEEHPTRKCIAKKSGSVYVQATKTDPKKLDFDCAYIQFFKGEYVLIE